MNSCPNTSPERIAGTYPSSRCRSEPQTELARTRTIASWLFDAGRDIVFVHGLGVSGRYLVPTARLLLGDARVHVPDLPGFGLSGGPRRALDIHALAGALGAWLAAARLLPAGGLATVPDVGHAVNYTAPRALARLVRAVLAC